jgi:glycine cleavage system transcriptional repressor
MADERRHVISVMSADRVGIIHDITEQVLSLRGNIVGLSQTVMRGYFTVLVEVVFPADTQAAHVLDCIS